MALTQSNLPPTPAAPIGEATTIIYALKDIESQRGPAGEVVVVHKRGHAQELPTAIARETVRTLPEGYGYEPPEGIKPITAKSTAATTGDKVSGLVEKLLADPEALAQLREALGTPASVQADAAREAGVAPISAAAGSAVQGVGGFAVPPPAGDLGVPFDLATLPGVNDKVARNLEDAGFGTLPALQNASVDHLSTVPGLGKKMAQNLADYVAETWPNKLPQEG